MMEFDVRVRQDVLTAAHILARPELGDEPGVLEALQKAGFTAIDSERLCFAIQLAFGRTVIKRLGVKDFSDSFVINSADGIELERNLAEEPYYLAACELASLSFLDGTIPRDKFTSIVRWSAELNAVNDALNSGARIAGGRMLKPSWNSTLAANDWRDLVS